MVSTPRRNAARSLPARICMFSLTHSWVKNSVTPKWNPAKWKHGPKPAFFFFSGGLTLTHTQMLPNICMALRLFRVKEFTFDLSEIWRQCAMVSRRSRLRLLGPCRFPGPAPSSCGGRTESPSRHSLRLGLFPRPTAHLQRPQCERRTPEVYQGGPGRMDSRPNRDPLIKWVYFSQGAF